MLYSCDFLLGVQQSSQLPVSTVANNNTDSSSSDQFLDSMLPSK